MDCTPTQHGYGGKAAEIVGCLPNTGLDVVYVVLIGLMLIALGLATAAYHRSHY